MSEFYSPCRCGQFERKVSGELKFYDYGITKVKEGQTVCANCGRHEPKR